MRGPDEHELPLPPESGTRLGRVGLWLGPAGGLLLLLLPLGALDDLQRRVAAVTFLTATWWITGAVPVGAASLLPAALFPLLGVLGGKEVAPLYLQDLVFLFLGAFVVALGVERWNVHRRFALWTIARIGTRPRRLVLGFMIASCFLSFWINNTSTTLLMLPIGVAVCASLGHERTGGFGQALMLGMAYSSSMGGIATPVGTAPNQVFLGQLHTLFPEAPEIGFRAWMTCFVPVVLVYVPVGWWILTRFAIRVPVQAGREVTAIAEERRALGSMGSGERRMTALFVLTALLWVTRADLDLGAFRLPGWGSLVAPEGSGILVTDATVATIMAVLLFVVPSGHRRGERLMDWPTAARLPWEVLLLLGGGFAIAGAFKSSGLDRVVGEELAPLFEDASPWLVTGVVVLGMAALTEITSNTATTAVLLPILGQAAVGAGLSPLQTMLPATVAASAAFMLPVATPPNAVVFASRLVPAHQMARVGLWMNLAVGAIVVLVFRLWVTRVIGIGEGLPAWAAR